VNEKSAELFLQQLQEHINWDEGRVKAMQQKLSLTDEEAVGLAETTLRVLGKRGSQP
jgi:hypothetical protein